MDVGKVNPDYYIQQYQKMHKMLKAMQWISTSMAAPEQCVVCGGYEEEGDDGWGDPIEQIRHTDDCALYELIKD